VAQWARQARRDDGTRVYDDATVKERLARIAIEAEVSRLLDILGAEAVLRREAGDAPLNAAVDEAFRGGVVGTIYGGSTEIMREIVAERVLGLPRSRSK